VTVALRSAPRAPWEKRAWPYIWAAVAAILTYPLVGAAVLAIGLAVSPFSEGGDAIAELGVGIVLFFPFVIAAVLAVMPLVVPVAAWAIGRGLAGAASGVLLGAVAGAGAMLDWLIDSRSVVALALGSVIGAMQGAIARAALASDWPEIALNQYRLP
jgi:hypothetical protein